MRAPGERRWHLFGLLSTAVVHSSRPILRPAEMQTKTRRPVFVHAFMERPLYSAYQRCGYLANSSRRGANTTGGQIATSAAATYAMDRDRRWERIAKATTHGLRDPRRQAAEIP